MLFLVTLAPRIASSLKLVRGAAKILRTFGKLHDSLAPPEEPGVDRADADIGSLAQAAAREGKITQAESNLVANAVRLDDIPVSQVLTPRPVVTAIEADLTVADVDFSNAFTKGGTSSDWRTLLVGSLGRGGKGLFALDVTDHGAVIAFCEGQRIGLVVVGPEAPLVDGLADTLRGHGFNVFGPSQAAAQLEGSKGFTKDLCQRAGIPTAGYVRTTSLKAATAAGTRVCRKVGMTPTVSEPDRSAPRSASAMRAK